MSAIATASWYHCSIEPMSRSDGRSAVAAAAYRFGMSLHDERYAVTHDYSRKRGVECAFMVAPVDAPDWAHDPERLWNEAERMEKKCNSRVAREAELALPAFLRAQERQSIVQEFSEALVERYGVAVAAALHAPSRTGDQRNYHAHIMFTTREVTAEGFGKKTRVIDDLKTGPQEITKLRELAADIINAHLADANSDIRVDHRSFKNRGLEREPTTHLGPTATEMERRGENSERGDMNREAHAVNTLMEERNGVETAIAREREQLSNPPTTREEERERIRTGVEPFTDAIRTHGELPENDGLSWWQRAALHVSMKARSLAQAIASKARELWRDRFGKDRDERQDRDERGPERDTRNPDDDRGIER